MDLSLAHKYAVDCHNWLKPFWERCEITGSVRRQRPQCADVDLCMIPRETVYKDLLGHVTGRQNHAWQFLVNYCNNFNPATLRRGRQLPKVLSGGEHAGQRMTVQLPGCQLDIWFATEETWANKLVNSTGSKEHNIWIAERTADYGLHWFVSQGLARLDALAHHGIVPALHDALTRASADNLILPASDETEFYSHLGLKFIEPANRDLPWLIKHVDSGL